MKLLRDFAYAENADRIEELADVAQLVEQLIRNQQVSGSTPLVGSTHFYQPPQNLKAADKTASGTSQQ